MRAIKDDNVEFTVEKSLTIVGGREKEKVIKKEEKKAK